MKEKLFTLKMNGYCCSQIVMQIGLEQMGRENEDMVEALFNRCDTARIFAFYNIFDFFWKMKDLLVNNTSVRNNIYGNVVVDET